MAALISVLVAPFAGIARHPPEVYAEWTFVGLVSTGAIVLALWCSARCSTRWYTHALLGGAILMDLLVLGVPLASYYRSFHDYPWGTAVPAAVALMVGGWMSRQRWLSVVLSAFLVFWFHGARRAPTSPTLPTSVTIDALTVTVQSLERKETVLFCGFQLKWKPGAEAGRYDLRGITLDGEIRPFIPVRCWRPHQWSADIQESLNEADFSACTFPPYWTRSYDLTITVPSWPPQPATSVTIAVPPTGGKPRNETWNGEGGGIRLAAGNVRWSSSRTTSPAPRCLALQITYSGYSYSGGTGQELKATDDCGRVIPVRSWSLIGSGNGATIEAELWPIARGVRHIRLDAYTEAQRARNRKVFRFQGLPNRTVNKR